jgi:hypothetical protein
MRARLFRTFHKEALMKILKLSLALAMVASSLGMTVTADAHPRGDRHRYEDRRDYRDHRRHYRDHHRYERPRHWNDRRYRGHHHRCWTEWRHHRKVRVCR